MGPFFLRAVRFSGDEDLRRGFVSGKVEVEPAGDESSILSYQLHWGDAKGRVGAPSTASGDDEGADDASEEHEGWQEMA